MLTVFQGMFQTMVQVIMNKRSLGIRYRLFHSGQLLGDIQARFFVFEHLDSALQMPCGTFQPFNDVGV